MSHTDIVICPTLTFLVALLLFIIIIKLISVILYWHMLKKKQGKTHTKYSPSEASVCEVSDILVFMRHYISHIYDVRMFVNT